MKYPKVSAIMPTYNGERTIRECLELFLSQDYPKEQIELIIMDGGSTDKTLGIIKGFETKYPKIIRRFHNPKQYKVGKGMGMDLASQKAKGELLFLIDQDNLMFQKNSLRKMVEILIKYKELSGVQAQMSVPEKGSILDKYIGATGIEDPFAIPYSLKSQIILNPKKFKFNNRGQFFLYKVNKDNFSYAGDNGYLTRKKDFFEVNGYTQDIDNFYRMALSKKIYKIAIPKNIKIYHKTSTQLKHFFKKRGFYLRFYILKNYEERNFYWINFKKNTFKQNLKFIKNIFSNLLIIPLLFQGIKMAIKQKRLFWLIHPIISFLITIEYIYSFFIARIFKKL